MATMSPRIVMADTKIPRISFKRRPKPPSSSSLLPRFLTGTGTGTGSATNLILDYLDTPADAGLHQTTDTKDAAGLDWYVEGPGRRVGYDDLTAIDWIFEYAKERQRLTYLYSGATGVLGSLRQLADASQVWIILVAAGVLAGGSAAFIDVASDWLADLKTGYCSSVEDDGRFYLNRGFCCWGIETGGQCKDWQEWGSAMGIASVGGKWIVEYIFFVLFSVSGGRGGGSDVVLMCVGLLCGVCESACQRVLAVCEAQRYPRDQDGVGWVRHKALPGWLDAGDENAWSCKSAVRMRLDHTDSCSVLQWPRGCG